MLLAESAAFVQVKRGAWMDDPRLFLNSRVVPWLSVRPRIVWWLCLAQRLRSVGWLVKTYHRRLPQRAS